MIPTLISSPDELDVDAAASLVAAALLSVVDALPPVVDESEPHAASPSTIDATITAAKNFFFIF
jgi:hypothetical protein